jgi:hypothetical protein
LLKYLVKNYLFIDVKIVAEYQQMYMVVDALIVLKNKKKMNNKLKDIISIIYEVGRNFLINISISIIALLVIYLLYQLTI